MRTKPGKVNWRGLFAGDPENVTVVRTDEGRTVATDRYALWDLSRVCEAEGVDVPTPGRYRAMVKELRPTRSDPIIPAQSLAALFDSFSKGIGPEPENRLALSAWSNGQHRPIVHTRTADVRRIDVAWDAVPRLSTGCYWVACTGWEKRNAAVYWGMYEQFAFGVVQLIGNAQYSEDWNMDPVMSYALCTAEAEAPVPWEIAAKRYPQTR